MWWLFWLITFCFSFSDCFMQFFPYVCSVKKNKLFIAFFSATVFCLQCVFLFSSQSSVIIAKTGESVSLSGSVNGPESISTYSIPAEVPALPRLSSRTTSGSQARIRVHTSSVSSANTCDADSLSGFSQYGRIRKTYTGGFVPKHPVYIISHVLRI